MAVYFNGEMVTVPGAYSSVDVSGMATKSSERSTKIIALIGESYGGEPEALQFFSDPVSAKKILKKGDLLDACSRAWNPVSKTKVGVDIGGANLIAAIRTNRGTKSSLNINTGHLVFESKDWNSDANNIEIKVAQATGDSANMNVTVHDSVEDIYEPFTNIGGLFRIKYTGDAAYASVSVVLPTENDRAMHFITKTGTDEEHATTDIDIKLKELDQDVLKSLQVLIQRLRSYEGYEIETVDGYRVTTKCSAIDPIADVDIKGVFGNITAFYDHLTSVLERDSHMVRLKSYDNTKGKVTPFDYQYLTGGSDGTMKASWVEYFDMLSNTNVVYIVPLTGEQSIHAELLAHVMAMSGNKGMERRMIVGGEFGESLADTLNRAKRLNNARCQVVHGGFYDYDSRGNLVAYPPYILAAQHAGRVAHLDDGEPATHDVYNMATPEYKLENGEINQLLQSGCLAFEFVLKANTVNTSFVRLVQDITTDTINTDTVHTERAVGELADSINREMRERCDAIITGKRTSVGDLTTVKNEVISVLFDRKKRGHIVAYKDVYVTKTGTVTTVDYSVAPSEPNNFTLITAHFYSQTITAEN